MQGIVMRKSNRTIVTVIQEVTRIEGNSIFGLNGSAEGINIDEAEIFVTDSEQEFERGQVFPEGMVNHIADFAKQKPEEIVAALQMENISLRQQLASTNADLVGFQNFIFEKFPELS